MPHNQSIRYLTPNIQYPTGYLGRYSVFGHESCLVFSLATLPDVGISGNFYIRFIPSEERETAPPYPPPTSPSYSSSSSSSLTESRELAKRIVWNPD